MQVSNLTRRLHAHDKWRITNGGHGIVADFGMSAETESIVESKEQKEREAESGGAT